MPNKWSKERQLRSIGDEIEYIISSKPRQISSTEANEHQLLPRKCRPFLLFQFGNQVCTNSFKSMR